MNHRDAIVNAATAMTSVSCPPPMPEVRTESNTSTLGVRLAGAFQSNKIVCGKTIQGRKGKIICDVLDARFAKLIGN